jgi:hypothetical protein
MAFVRAVAIDSVSGRDSVIVFRDSGQFAIDSLVRRSRGVAAGPRVRAFTIEATESDSIVRGVVWRQDILRATGAR